MKRLFPVYEFRPLPRQLRGEIRRYAKGLWIPDDGEYDLAFAVIGNGAPMCFKVYLPYRPNILWSWAKDGNWSGHVYGHPDGNAWHYLLRSGETEWGDTWARDAHPNTIAGESGMSYVSQRCRCANGAGPEFHIGDEYILSGLVRERHTKKVVVFPKEFDCMYCGRLDTGTDKRLNPIPQSKEE